MSFKRLRPLCLLSAAVMSAAIMFAACTKPDSGTGDKDKPGDGDIVIEDPTKQDPVYDGSEVNVSSVYTNDYGSHIRVDGSDFVYLGAQLRIDGFMNCEGRSMASMEPLFKEAAELGVTCVEVPIEWAKLEVAQDKWDYTYLFNVLQYANKYNLKMELLWYGTNMCGDTHSYTVPDYILRDGKTYPKFDALRTGEFWNYYGIMWYLDFDNENLIARESNALTKMMEYIYDYDSTHGAKKPVIGVQVLNEPDIFIRHRVEKYNILSRTTGERIGYEEGVTKICNSLNALGKAVKACKYKVYTRMNFAASNGKDSFGQNNIYTGNTVNDPSDFVKRVYALEGIDIVGDDTYTSSVRNVKGVISQFATKLPGNVSHIAENDGKYSNTPSLMLAAFSQHGGYLIYDLMTPVFFMENSGGLDQGVLEYDKTDKAKFVITKRPHYAQTQLMIKGLKLVSSEIYNLSNEDFICFNVAGDYAETETTQAISSTNVTVNFETAAGAVGYALDMGGYLNVYVTASSKITLANGTVTAVKTGTYSGGKFNEETSAAASGAIDLEAGKLYRIEYSSAGKIESTTWDTIGG